MIEWIEITPFDLIALHNEPFFLKISVSQPLQIDIASRAGCKMNCGFCGTHVPENYTVCTGCHAVYKTESGVGCRPALPMLLGLIILCSTPIIAELALNSPFTGTLIFITGLVLFIAGRRRLKRLNKVTPRVGRWYRQNP